MADETLEEWLRRHSQKRRDNAPPGQPEPAAIPSCSGVFHSGNEPPLLAALRRVYCEQKTSSDCSLTSVTLLLQALMKEGAPSTKEEVLAIVDNALPRDSDKGAWQKATQDKGSGVTFAELVRYATAAFGNNGFNVSSVQPGGDRLTEEGFRAHLQALVPGSPEYSPGAALLLYVDQGVFRGEGNYLHVTPIGAYHPGTDQVLIVEVDSDLPPLYLSRVETVMEAMRRPGDKTQGELCGERGGWLWIEPRRPRMCSCL